MKAKVNYTLGVLTLLLLFISNILIAAPIGKVSGTVVDKKTGETLVGVTVRIAGTRLGASTDIEGRFMIAGLATGKYNLEVSYVGYVTQTISDVEIKENATTPLNVVLEESADNNLSEVKITFKASQESVNNLYANQKASINISSGISAELIRRSPDKNTSEVLKRVSGASIQDNKFIVVRGLSDRYNSAMLNNAVLPNTEVDKKAFSFDILPSNLIDAIVVNKTASADIPGDFSGGVVQVTTKDFPDAKFLNFSLGTAYNFQSAFKDFQRSERGSGEVFGFASKNREIPANFPSRSTYLELPIAERVALSKQFSNNWGYNNVKSVLGPIFQANYGTSKRFKDDSQFGTVLSLSYRYDERLRKSEQIAYMGDAVGDIFNDNVYNYNTNIGGLANFAYSWGTNKIALKNIYNRVLENQFTAREGIDDSGSGFFRTADYLLQRSLISTQLSGNHQLSENSKIKLDWNLNFANTDRKEPGFKRMEYQQESGQGGYTRVSIPSSGQADPRLAGDFNSSLNENLYGGAFDVTIPVKWIQDKNKIKLGYFGQYRKRDFAARVLGFIRNGQFDTDLLTLPQNQIFAPENIRENGFVLSDITNGSDIYDANSFLNAGYAMFDGFVTEKLRVGLGARLESYNQKLNSADNAGTAINVDTTYVNLLPSANLIYNLTEKASLRLSGSQTVGRPEFREIAPFGFYDFNKNVSVVGNPNLKQSKTTNVDLGYALYPSAGQVFSVSAFYKNFDLPIEQRLELGSTGRIFGYGNSESATLYGIEMEFRRPLDLISERLKNFTFSANASYMKSEVKVSTTVNSTGKRPLQGQSPYLINAGLQYNSKVENATGVSLLFNRIGKRIWAVGNVIDPDIYENSRNILDLQFSKRFANSRAEIKLNYSDILNNRAIYYQKAKGSDPDAAFDKQTDRINIADTFGSTLTIGFSYRIK
ncbi:TonB-dependent receptor [Pedobacter quisquiliarum]|uniref:TonB-dependent receptor n=1 Tax=Pedobacter quisquiliarum TaxID=1834438 RepID=A0A916UKI6_9SPHI|nr:TonB-dependent receptor [Pedobacter quisquiliarum]GGC75633.1 TonB-dependent receptor [Pedobacter quisquiliarum]